MEETFYYLGMEFDIEKAKEITKGRKTDTNTNPRAWKQFLGWPFTNHLGISVDGDHLEAVDLTQPLIGAIITFPRSGKTTPFILDGWHRIARALKEDVEELPVVMLTPEELKKVQVQ